MAASEHLAQHGWAVVNQPQGVDTTQLREWTEEIFALGMMSKGRDLQGVWHHYEALDAPRYTALTRSENFASNHRGMRSLLLDDASPIAKVVGETWGMPVTLYKEKINYKQPGGSGYTAHQDAPAYPELKRHITCLCPVDDMGLDNGCLEFASGQWNDLLETTRDGVIAPAAAEKLVWTPVPLNAGDVLIFTSYVPHRSRQNDSNRPRRALYLTFNPAEDGEHRTAYYTNKASQMQRNRISLINHFNGSIVHGAEEVSAAVRELFAIRGDTQYDPSVTQLEHALQSATLAQAERPDDAELIVAALLHDIGHLVLNEHDSDSTFLQQNLEHEAVGHAFLQSRFTARVAAIVLHHVDAKRYLCGTDAAYYDGLSAASKKSLALQGGPFTQEECRVFEAKPFAIEAVQIRRWDDCAKVKNKQVPGLESFMPYVARAAAAADVPAASL